MAPSETAGIGVGMDGNHDVLSIWVSAASEGAKYELNALTNPRNRGVMDVFLLACAGLKGLPDAVGTVRPLAIVQTCAIHPKRRLVRETHV